MTFAERGPLLALLLLVLSVNVLTMPADLYVGDPQAPRKEAAYLLTDRAWGIPYVLRDQLGELASARGQYFWENDGRGRFYSKYGPLNTVLSLPPLWAERMYRGELPLSGSTRSLLFFLNLYNVLLSLVIALFLYRLAALYTDRAWLAAAYVAACFYGTFLWHYLRAQTLEIFQVLFFLGFSLHFLRFKRDGGGRNIRRAAAWLAGLCLLKFYYLPLFPLAAWHVRRAAPERRREAFAALSAWGAAALALLAAASSVKFGNALRTGYEQWREGGAAHDRFSLAGIPGALRGFLFSPARSVFIHFPVLLAALYGGAGFYGKNKDDARFIAAVGVFFLSLLSGASNWAGLASYGPRYLLFLLPALSLPALEIFRGAPVRRRAAAAVSAAVLAGSFILQWNVNRLPFFTYDRVAGPFESYGAPEIDAYFEGRPFGMVNADLSAFLDRGRPFPPMEMLARRLPMEKRDAELDLVRRRLREIARPNFFFFPGAETA